MAAEKNKKEESTAEQIDRLSRVIIALIVGVVIGSIVSQLGLDTLQNQIQNLIFVFLWMVIVSGLLVFWVVQNKHRLLKKLFGVSDTDLSELNKTGQSLFFNIVEKDYDKARRDLSLLFRKTTAWYSWMNFRRWVIIAFQALMVGLAGVLGTIMLYNQNKLLTQQNQLLNQQNVRLDQQTYLQEAERRSSLIFLMGNILDGMSQELKEDVGKPGVRDITPQLVGRIIALSNSLRPYRYLGNDSLVGRELSPERGYLLMAIANSEIDKGSLRRIYQDSDFSFSDLKGAVLSGEYMEGINLTGAELVNARLDDADLSGANLSDAVLSEAILTGANLTGARLRNTNLHRANLVEAKLVTANLSEADLRRANFLSADMFGAHLNRANLTGANLSFATINRANFDLAEMDSVRVREFIWLDSLHQMGIDSPRGTNYLTNHYYIDSLKTNLGWFYVLMRKKSE